MIEPEHPHTVRWGELEVPATALTREQADQIIAMIANTSNIQIPRDMYLWNIVNEESSRYFAGQITAQDAARIIQSRTSIYMSEQAG